MSCVMLSFMMMTTIKILNEVDEGTIRKEKENLTFLNAHFLFAFP